MAKIWNSKDKKGRWVPHFSKSFNDWEVESVERFLMKLQGNRVYRDDDDKVVWTGSRSGSFSIKSLYHALDPNDPLVFPSRIT